MEIRWLLSAVAAFSLLAYLGIWGYSLMFDNNKAGDPLMEPPAESIPEPEPAPLPPPGMRAVPPDSEPVSDADEDMVRRLGFELSGTAVDPGGFLVLSAYAIEDPEMITVSNPFGVKLHFYQVEDHLSALLPVKFTFDPGRYLLSVEGGGYQESFTITVRDRDFPTQELTVEQSTVDSTIHNESANTEYFSRVQPVKFEAVDQPLWNDAFLLPVDGSLTSAFGFQRIVNGVPGERHSGIDLAAETGTPVLAANSGKVLFADFVALTGNTVCIEHGLGLKSWYYHMNSLNVTEGETVGRGQQIGSVGSTGFSTGPHLHFAISVWNVYVDPQLLLDAELKV